MNDLVRNIEIYATEYLKNRLSDNYLYHNLSHTKKVVRKTIILCESENLDEISTENLIIAAWFHDIGYCHTCKNHEDKSIEIAKEYLNSVPISADRLDRIQQIIGATKINHTPISIEEKIIRDADSAHLGSKSFYEVSDTLRRELNHNKETPTTEIEWIDDNVRFLLCQHSFYTNFALDNWQEIKEKNLGNLYRLKDKFKEEKDKKEKKKSLETTKNKKEGVPEKGVETMFRVTFRNHITLSDIADTKANILLSVNAIIISLALSNLIPKLDNPSNTYLIIPTIIFVCFTVASIILSVLATRPKVTEGKFSKEDVKNKKVNLIFFGNFHKMSLDDFDWAMNEMMQDKNYLYSSMIKDLYFLGKVLDRKYKILRLTYTVFIVGIIVSVISFGYALHSID